DSPWPSGGWCSGSLSMPCCMRACHGRPRRAGRRPRKIPASSRASSLRKRRASTPDGYRGATEVRRRGLFYPDNNKSDAMKKKPCVLLPVGLTAGLAQFPALAGEGLIEGASATLQARTYYFSRDYSDIVGASQQSKAEEWAQGFILNF